MSVFIFRIWSWGQQLFCRGWGEYGVSGQVVFEYLVLFLFVINLLVAYLRWLLFGSCKLVIVFVFGGLFFLRSLLQSWILFANLIQGYLLSRFRFFWGFWGYKVYYGVLYVQVVELGVGFGQYDQSVRGYIMVIRKFEEGESRIGFVNQLWKIESQLELGEGRLWFIKERN